MRKTGLLLASMALVVMLSCMAALLAGIPGVAQAATVT